MSMKWQVQNTDQMMNSQRRPNIPNLQMSYGVSSMSIWEKNATPIKLNV